MTIINRTHFLLQITMENVSLNIHKEEMTKDEFTKLSNSIFNICGINLPEVKKILIEGRIRKRMIQLRIKMAVGIEIMLESRLIQIEEQNQLKQKGRFNNLPFLS